MNPTYKPAWTTTEFWITVGTLCVSVLVGVGAIQSTDADRAASALTQFFAAAVNTISVFFFLRNRTQLKIEQAVLIAKNPDLCSKCGRPLPPPLPVEATNVNVNVNVPVPNK